MKRASTLLSLALAFGLSGCVYYVNQAPDQEKPDAAKKEEKKAPPPADYAVLQGDDGAMLYYVGDFGIVVRDFPSPTWEPARIGAKDPDLMAALKPMLSKAASDKAQMELTLDGYLWVKAPAKDHDQIKELIAGLRDKGWRVPAPDESDLPAADHLDGRRFITDFPEW